MQAVRFNGAGSPLTVEELPIPVPETHEALIRVRAVSICGSDVHIRDGHTPVASLPLTLGHEIAGEIVELGTALPGLEVGNRVIINPIIGCGDCRYCVVGETNFCPQKGLLGIAHDGGMAEYVKAPLRNLTVLPDTISFSEIAMIESGGTANHGLRVLELERGETVVVVGAGGLGLQVVRIAVARGQKVVVVDPSDMSRARALEVGAHAALSPEEFGRRHTEIADDLGSEHGFAGAVDCVGFESTLLLALESLRPRAACSIIGIGSTALTLTPPAHFIRNSLRVFGIYTFTERDFAEVSSMLASGQISLAGSVSEILPLDQADLAFERFTTATPKPVRIVLEP